MEHVYYQMEWILQEYYIVCGKCVTMCWGWSWGGSNPSIAQPRFFYKLPKIYTKPHEKRGLPMVITIFTDGGGLHDEWLLQRFITGISIIISLLYIVTYLKIKVMKGKINYEERLLELLHQQENAAFSYVPISYLKIRDCKGWLN